MLQLLVKRHRCAALVPTVLLWVLYLWMMMPRALEYADLWRMSPSSTLLLAEEDGQPTLDYSQFHFDASGKYKVVPFAAVGSEWSTMSDEPLCLATHASVHRVQSALETLASWGGPASVTIFDPDPPRLTALFLERLRTCSPQVYRKTAFHAIIPAEKSPSSPENLTQILDDFLRGEESGGCKRMPKEFRQMGNSGPTKEFFYPQNLARNTAMQRCPTEWVLTADADMVPPPSLARRFGKFLRGKGATECGPQCAFVVPIYEVVRPKVSSGRLGGLPDTKAQLLELKRQGKARQYHVTVFKLNQEASNLSKWEERTSNGSDGADAISVSHQVGHFPFFYEPVYVSRRGVPPFDERFVGFGLTRNTQAYEMFLRGYTFKVMDNAFLIHWEFQERKKRPLWRERQALNNYRIFQKWILEKSVQYDADPNNMIEDMAGNQRKRKVTVALRSKPAPGSKPREIKRPPREKNEALTEKMDSSI